MRLGFMASGRGSNILAILNAIKDKTLCATPVLIISNNSNSGALEMAKEHGLEAIYLSSKTHADEKELDKKITTTMIEHDIDLIVLAGYMKKIGESLLQKYQNRIVNIHPSLLPKFGGQGMYGMNVHRAVIASNESVSGVTIHMVNEQYDQGQILAQESVTISEGETAESLAKKVLKIEHQLYPQTLQKIISGEISL